MADSKIYALVDQTTHEVRYIGKSKDPQRRFKAHLKDRRLSHKTCWLKGIDYRADCVVLEECVDWAEAERFWVAYFKFLGARLTNMTTGGEGVPGAPRSAETRAKMSASRKGCKVSLGVRIKMSERLIGNTYSRGVKHTEETRKKVSVALMGNTYAKGFKHSEETKRKVSEGGKGRVFSEIHKQRLRGPKSEETKARMAAAWRVRKGLS